MAHTHSIVDNDNHFVIDPVTRTVQNNSNKVRLVQNDHNSERFTFECPRFIEEHDMSLCDSIKVLYINLNKKTQEETCGIYEVDDLAINANNLEQITFSWLISRNATSFAGSLTFMVQMTCISDDGTVDYCWQTGITKGITIVDGMDNEETIVEDYPDILQKWKNDILGASVPTDEEIVQELLDADALPAVTVNGEILTDENGNILMW